MTIRILRRPLEFVLQFNKTTKIMNFCQVVGARNSAKLCQDDYSCQTELKTVWRSYTNAFLVSLVISEKHFDQTMRQIFENSFFPFVVFLTLQDSNASTFFYMVMLMAGCLYPSMAVCYSD